MHVVESLAEFPPCSSLQKIAHHIQRWLTGEIFSKCRQKQCLQKYIFVVLTFSTTVFAQDTGVVTGTVSDNTGASIAEAQIKISNTERGLIATQPQTG